MCDTLVVVGSASADGVTLFGKNSDREPNEAHEVVAVPAADHARGARVRCTYVEIEQAPHTYATLLAKPFQIWGAEMGANEHGLTIGNEAVFTRVPYRKTGGLLGMDLLRLALERARTAEEGVRVATRLLEAHGQGGNAGYRHTLFYHNSFLLADPSEAWVLETAGPHYAAKRVEGAYTISNRLSIDRDWDVLSSDALSYAVDRGWCRGQHDFGFARCYSDYLYTRFSDSAHRCRRSASVLHRSLRRVTPREVMDTLRDHGDRHDWRPDRGLTGSEVCMHAGVGPVRASQTTGSMVSWLHPDRSVHFVTATAAPCLSLFKPVWVDTGLPPGYRRPGATYDHGVLFWRHEARHRAALADLDFRLDALRADRARLEDTFIAGALDRRHADPAERAAFTQACFDEAEKAESAWADEHGGIPARPSLLYRRVWAARSRQAGMPDPFAGS